MSLHLHKYLYYYVIYGLQKFFKNDTLDIQDLET